MFSPPPASRTNAPLPTGSPWSAGGKRAATPKSGSGSAQKRQKADGVSPTRSQSPSQRPSPATSGAVSDFVTDGALFGGIVGSAPRGGLLDAMRARGTLPMPGMMMGSIAKPAGLQAPVISVTTTPPRRGGASPATDAKGLSPRNLFDVSAGARAVAGLLGGVFGTNQATKVATETLAAVSSRVSPVAQAPLPIVSGNVRAAKAAKGNAKAAAAATTSGKKLGRPPGRKAAQKSRAPTANSTIPAAPREPLACEILRRVELPPVRPEDSYEISDKEDSSDEAAVERAEQERARKAVPEWCGGYEEFVLKQAEVDPDSIFGVRVPDCNLDAIFPDALYRARGRVNPRRPRGSSCLWSKDRLRPCEVALYRQKMGQRRKWSMLGRRLTRAPTRAVPVVNAVGGGGCADGSAPASR
mmetsp:Transcript_86485/g.242090  ORF Transcript_86485/g.242090 Transcript_86485/m.242090 type:complete len:413 (+) Transcript_86485:114-1352(+)